VLLLLLLLLLRLSERQNARRGVLGLLRVGNSQSLLVDEWCWQGEDERSGTW
jgi:hypothetical protein